MAKKEPAFVVGIKKELSKLKAEKEQEFEFALCVITPKEVTEDQMIDMFTAWVEANGWSFGGGINKL
ncbi:MAG: hypothetical protein V4714_08240 [Bacteroidota bacterium]